MKLSSRPPLPVHDQSVCVIIPSFRRPEGLSHALASVARQEGINPKLLHVIVCDNDPEASARAQVLAFGEGQAFKVSYLHEPRTGVANARNLAISACDSALIAFLDDDEIATPLWLISLMGAQKALGAEVVFGQIETQLPPHVIRFKPYFSDFFARKGPSEAQRIDGYFGCGNALIVRSSLKGQTNPFALERNQIGGEDDLLFSQLKAQGVIMGWSPEALVYEAVPASRARLGYTLLRAFAYGQGPSQACASSVPPKILGCAKWMIQGLIQGLIMGLLGLVAFGLGHKNSAAWLDKSVRGFGKLLWFPPFKIRFYGQAMLMPKAKGR